MTLMIIENGTIRYKNFYIKPNTKSFSMLNYNGLSLDTIMSAPTLSEVWSSIAPFFTNKNIAVTEGDIIVVRQQPDVETNEIAVVLVNGDEGTVKRIKKEYHGIFLIGDNAMAFSPKFYSNKEIRDLPVKIIGKVIELRRSF